MMKQDQTCHAGKRDKGKSSLESQDRPYLKMSLTLVRQNFSGFNYCHEQDNFSWA